MADKNAARSSVEHEEAKAPTEKAAPKTKPVTVKQPVVPVMKKQWIYLKQSGVDNSGEKTYAVIRCRNCTNPSMNDTLTQPMVSSLINQIDPQTGAPRDVEIDITR